MCLTFHTIPILLLLFFYTSSGLLAQEKSYTKEDYELVIRFSSEKLQEDSLKNNEYFKSRAQAYYALEEFGLALRDFNSYLRMNPTDSYTYYNRGALKNILGQFELAINDFSRAIDFSTENPSDFYFARGAAYQTLKNYPKAISDYNESIECNPRNQEALNNLGLLFIEKKDYQTAMSYLDKALQIDADYISSLINRAYVLIELGHYKKALLDLRYALKLSPDNPYANNYMGYFLYKQNKKMEACKYFKIVTSAGIKPLIDIKYCE